MSPTRVAWVCPAWPTTSSAASSSTPKPCVAVTSPTVNCYKRLQVGQALYGSRSGFLWTPASITYGDNNRTQMVRTAGPGHFEDRTISAGCNLYLALAAYSLQGWTAYETTSILVNPTLATCTR